MRLWSLHPKYLDTKGLVALWRESLLAKHVLEGKTKGYTQHPQLNRFRKAGNPVELINQYLSEVFYEAEKRGHTFDKQKIDFTHRKDQLTVTSGQMDFEITHLLKKLERRDPNRYNELKSNTIFDPHPLFAVVDGEIEDWEILS